VFTIKQRLSLLANVRQARLGSGVVLLCLALFSLQAYGACVRSASRLLPGEVLHASVFTLQHLPYRLRYMVAAILKDLARLILPAAYAVGGLCAIAGLYRLWRWRKRALR
jgi:hypothetical protein